jgi:hypothetical protein
VLLIAEVRTNHDYLPRWRYALSGLCAFFAGWIFGHRAASWFEPLMKILAVPIMLGLLFAAWEDINKIKDRKN